MNTKIFSYVVKNLNEIWHLPRYESIRQSIAEDTALDQFPWTESKKNKFQQALKKTFDLDQVPNLQGSIRNLVRQIDRLYMMRFFGEIWKPKTESYFWSGWRIAEEINKLSPRRVLDVGCGYHPFKGRIDNLTGIDPYNNCADFMVDILDYRVEPGSYDHIIALGSINFNDLADIEERFSHVVDLLAPNGSLWMRANPGISWPNGPWVDIFPWTFESAYQLSKKYGCEINAFKQDHDRLFIRFIKSDTVESQNSAAAA